MRPRAARALEEIGFRFVRTLPLIAPHVKASCVSVCQICAPVSPQSRIRVTPFHVILILLGVTIGESVRADQTVGMSERAPTLVSTPSVEVVAEPVSPDVSDVPAVLKDVSPLLARTLELFGRIRESTEQLQQVRADYDAGRTQLIVLGGELELLTQDHRQLEQQLQVLERRQQEQSEVLRKDLETRVQEELAQVRREVLAESERQFVRQVQTFETRQRELVGKQLQDDIQRQTREIEQLRQDLDLQAEELASRLTRLDEGTQLGVSLRASMTHALEERKQRLEARRQQLDTERNTLVAQRRETFASTLKQQLSADQQKRLIMKEANIRQAMAQLLQQMHQQEARHLEPIRTALERTTTRQAALTSQRDTLQTRLVEQTKQLSAMSRRLEALDAESDLSIARFEQALQHANPTWTPQLAAWFNRAIRQAPAESAAELSAVQQRVLARAQEAQQVDEQRRLIRERQLALQTSREMERQVQVRREQQQQQHALAARDADALMAKSKMLAQRGRFEEAMQWLDRAEQVNPPEPIGQAILLTRQQLQVAQQEAASRAEYAKVQTLFGTAMKAFDSGRYEEAIGLFEQVVTQESQLNHASHDVASWQGS